MQSSQIAPLLCEKDDDRVKSLYPRFAPIVKDTKYVE